METLIAGGIQLIVALQQAPWLEAPMRFFTFLGTADFFFLALPVLYWCVDASLGMRVAFILLFGNAFTTILKLGLHGPRPYWVSAQVKALAAEPSFGVPSSHAQIATGVWGMIAARVGRRWAWIAAILLIFFIGASRLYLGVHFPHDVVVGWLLGALTLWAFLTFWDRLVTWVRGLTLLQQSLLILGTAAVMLLEDAWLVYGLRGYVLPPEWLANAARAGGAAPPEVSMTGMLTPAGALIGLAFGLIWIGRRGGFKPSGPLWKRAVSFVLGLIGTLILYLGLKAVFPADEGLVGSSLRLVRYAAIGLWVSAGAPFLFRGLHLVAKPTD